MRRAAWGILLLYVFAVPWEYSLDLGAPLGNIARILGIVLMLVAIPAALRRGMLRRPGAMQWAAIALYLWVWCGLFWTIDQAVTLEKVRGYIQEMMVVWIAWEFAENERDFGTVVRAMIAGCWVLGILTLWSAVSPGASALGQIRFAAFGQDPNDVARYLDLGFPLAALLIDEDRWLPSRWMAVGYFPMGVAAVLLTASRGGFVEALVALAGCSILLWRKHRSAVLGSVWISPVPAACIWMLLPPMVLQRISTIPQQLMGGNLNHRLNIWSAGWEAFKRAPILGFGAGTFVDAAGTAPVDTAHNSALSILVEMGVVGLIFASLVLVLAVRAALRSRGPKRTALLTALSVWLIASMVGTATESRTTWLLFAMASLAGRLATENQGKETEWKVRAGCPRGERAEAVL
ncbi:MAG TPA: O-antigen ligase family protein [Terracidiphilus sp.]|nr:O-antigen ligase family protein [Terracidiphilus sp.]